ncbi:WbqC-like protein [Bernardetia litoralis DSM 6794]|uniref:WbqC-like protein n=1 Tax=Bernardetia litoralis (strain ATCC 23117 / DSM 6794 / NBRC 15988 / NCIMB 1366 / Fx l1 / Sio-4) TaxID=880071 RepID=I4AGK1_BERLS|nr:WbqC family protein [Bernardetia litoralis]AFM03086.1 WbqC-like protein [Bernardetia litoralis DSM 6794]
MQKILIELHYLPCLDYFKTILEANKEGKEIILEANENFNKQSYRNRAYILGANGKLALTVPVQKGSQKTIITDVKIDYKTDWNRKHWQSIKSAYGKSPFFIHYADFLEPIYENPPALLWEFNYKLLTICQKLLRISIPSKKTDSFDKEVDSNILDKRNSITPKKPAIFAHKEYYQTFGNKFENMDATTTAFENNLSILDLLFNEGTNAMAIIKG